jgi:hypothetical protein
VINEQHGCDASNLRSDKSAETLKTPTRVFGQCESEVGGTLPKQKWRRSDDTDLRLLSFRYTDYTPTEKRCVASDRRTDVLMHRYALLQLFEPVGHDLNLLRGSGTGIRGSHDDEPAIG